MTKLHPLRVLLCATLVLPACVADDATPTSDDPAGEGTATATDGLTATAARAYAPACIARPVHYLSVPPLTEGWVDLTNNCGKTMHVKVVLSLGGDTDCMTMKAGATKQVTWWLPTDYDYTITC